MIYNRHYYDLAADTWMLQPGSSEGSECDANSTDSSDTAVLHCPCDYESELAELNEDVEKLRPEIPGWQRYFKERDTSQ